MDFNFDDVPEARDSAAVANTGRKKLRIVVKTYTARIYFNRKMRPQAHVKYSLINHVAEHPDPTILCAPNWPLADLVDVDHKSWQPRPATKPKEISAR
jgi:hypothetical protein